MRKKGGMLVIMLTLTIVCGIIVTAAMYGIFHILVFPDGRFVNWRAGGAGAAIGTLIGIGFIFSLLGGFIFYITRRELTNAAMLRDAVERKEAVKIISKASQLDGSFFATTYTIAFEFPDRTRKVFDVGRMQYSEVMEGEIGMLTYKHNDSNLSFVSFHPHPKY